MNGVVAAPQVRIQLSGSPISDALRAGVSAVSVRRLLSAPAQCEITILDPGPASDTAEQVEIGASLVVNVGGQERPVFSGEVTAVERSYRPDHGVEIRIRGYDLLHRLRQRRSLRAHIQVTASDIAAELVTPLGLRVDATADGPAWGHLIQHGQSDLDLLLQVTESIGAFVVVDEDVVRLVTLDGDGDPVPLELGHTLLEATIEENADGASRSVTTSGWDPHRLELHAATVGEPRSGKRDGAQASVDRAVRGRETVLPDEPVVDERHARALAQAHLDVAVAGEITLWGIARGDAELRPGARIEVSNVHPSVGGRYVVTEVRHTVDRRSGFLSEISTRPPIRPDRPRPATISIGSVTRIDDPEGLGRIQVELPTFGQVLTAWLGVVAVGAGPGKGLVALPDIGDRVVVAMPHDDPTYGIVIGSLYGADGPPDAGVDQGRVRRFSWRTPGGHRVQLDDASGSVRLENTAGSLVELRSDGVTLHSEGDVTLDAPGRTIRIRGASIEFETG